MNLDGIYEFCEILRLGYGNPRWIEEEKGNISISCPLAPWLHDNPYDSNWSCSISFNEDLSPSKVKCFSFNCNYQGWLFDLLSQVSGRLGNPDRMVEFLKRVRSLEEFDTKARCKRAIHVHASSVTAWKEVKKKRPVPKDDHGVIPERRLEEFLVGPQRYLSGRGVVPQTQDAWGIRYDERLQRVVFPVRRYDGKLVGMSGRDVTNRHKTDSRVTKYHNYGGLDKTRYLFGEHWLEPECEVILVEGQVDALKVWQALRPHPLELLAGAPSYTVVAPLGEGFSRTHIRTLTAFRVKNVTLYTDNDSAGIYAAEKFNYALHGRIPVYLTLPPEGADPGKLTDEQNRAAIQRRKSVPGKRIKWHRYRGAG